MSLRHCLPLPRFAALAVLLVCLLVSDRSLAETLPAPEGPVLLEVTGAISKGNARDDQGRPLAELDLALLERFGGTLLETETPWTQGPVVFEGIAGAQLIDLLGVEGQTAAAVALNDYRVDIPVSDFRDAELLIAYRRDGEAMRVRDKGPLWIVFPFSDDAKYGSNDYLARSVWQLHRLDFR